MEQQDPQIRKIEEAIASGAGELLEKVRSIIRAPHTGDGMRETAALVRRALTETGCRETEIFETRGNPVVFGSLPAGAPSTLVVYLMYDTAPVLDAPAWTHPPFAAELADVPQGKAVIGRGSMARRGPMIAFLDVVQRMQRLGIRLPVNLLFVAEGDENIGSPYLPDFYTAHRDLFAAASATLFPAAAEENSGTAIVRLGAKGMLGLELVCDGASWGSGPTRSDTHWANAAWVDSPMWRLAHAVTTLSNADGSQITIDGFYDNVAPIGAAEQAMLQALPFDEAHAMQEIGIKRFAAGARGPEALRRNLYEPVLSLQGVWGSVPPISRLYKTGYARLDLRIVYNQTADEIEEKVREHLRRRGYGDIQVRRLYALPPSKVDGSHPIIRSAITTYREFGIDPQLWPSQPRTPPVAVFERPYVMFGVGHGGNQAAKDEYLLVTPSGRLHGLVSMAQSFARFLFTYAELGGRS
jgi:acetylornithine deacetylase/succinyl-diaminopimelate desuccinylase-like protein